MFKSWLLAYAETVPCSKKRTYHTRLALEIHAPVIRLSRYLLCDSETWSRLASVHPSATPIWPPTGFALAAVLLFGYRIWPAIFLAAFLANATTAGSIYTSAAIAAGNTLEAVIGSWLLNRWSDGRNTFETPAGVARFALLTFVPTMISATVGVGSLSLAGFADWSKFSSIWLTWWMGDLAGALVVAPVIVLWSDSIARKVRPQYWSEAVAIFMASIAVGVVAFSPLLEQTAYRGALAFLVIVPLLWAALRRGQRDTAIDRFVLCGVGNRIQ